MKATDAPHGITSIGPPSTPGICAILGRIRQALPAGRTLPDETWSRRHRGITAFLAFHVPLVVGFGVATKHGILHSLGEGSLPAVAVLLAGWKARSKRARSCAATLGLALSSALLIHFSGGATALHFHFFVVVAVVALYEDWLPFLAAIGFVAVHHSVLGTLKPQVVFDEPYAIAQPWLWATIHAMFVLAASAAAVVAWHLNERSRSAVERAAALQTVLAELGERSIASDDLDAVYNDAVRTAASALGYEYGGILELAPDGQAFVVRALEGWPRDGVGDVVPAGRAAYTTAAGGQVASENPTGETRFLPLAVFEQHGIASGLTVPIPGRDGPLGVLDLHTTRETVAGVEEERFLGGVANIVAAATEKAAVERAATAAERRYRQMFDGAVEGLYRATIEGRMLIANDAMARIHGYESVGQFIALVPDVRALWVDSDRRDELIRLVEEHGYVKDFETEVRRRDGSTIWIGLSVSGVRDETGSLVELDGVLEDRTATRAAEEQLAHAALHDPLTGLPNRTLFCDRVTTALARSHRTNEPPAVLFVDLDRFKTINDGLGHQAGDRVLRDFAGRLTATLREGDTLARFGGDEFVVLCENIQAEAVSAVAERILAEAKRVFTVGEHQVYIGASIGIAVPGPADDVEALLRDADAAMYRAKAKGKGRYEVFDETTRLDAVARLHIGSALAGAVERGEFRMWFQPEIDLTTDAIVGVEALIRWEHPHRGLLGPYEFLPQADAAGLSRRIDEWVLATTTRRAKAWEDEGLPPIPIAVNISPALFASADLEAVVCQALEESGLAPDRLELEMPESITEHDPSQIIPRLLRLREIGVRFAIDDFGAGYSFLKYLKHFPVDKLKLDRSFIAQVTVSPTDAVIVRHVIQIAQGLDIVAVAEGIETEDQRAFLRRAGCALGQGYLTGRPMPETEFLQRLAEAGTTWNKEQTMSRTATAFGRPPVVFIVDDDPAVRGMLTSMLTRSGFVCAEASNGADAVARVREVRPDLILMDVAMPVLSGTDALATLRHDPDTTDIPIIMVSGQITLDDKALHALAGADGYVTKPFKADELIARVRTQLSHKRTA